VQLPSNAAPKPAPGAASETDAQKPAQTTAAQTTAARNGKSADDDFQRMLAALSVPTKSIFKDLMNGKDGKCLIKCWGGGKYSCNVCDSHLLSAATVIEISDTRELGEAMSGLCRHLGTGKHKQARHKSMTGQELSKSELDGLTAAAPASLTNKRSGNSSKAKALKIAKIAKGAASGAFTFTPPLAAAAAAPSPVPFGAQMAGAFADAAAPAATP
jgi:hypothetical protein